jgi:hypothetical protein
MTALQLFANSVQESFQNLASLLLCEISLRGYTLGQFLTTNDGRLAFSCGQWVNILLTTINTRRFSFPTVLLGL